MKTLNYLKAIFIFTFLTLEVNGFNLGCVTGTKMQSEDALLLAENRLSIPRESIPPSLQGRVIQTQVNALHSQKISSSSCPEDSLCASFDRNTTPEDVAAWMGFQYNNEEGSYFIATYSQEAIHLGNNVYATKKWDKGHFWMHIGEDIVPFPIQPRFVGVDKETGYEWHVVDYLGYRRPGVDYSNYWENMSEGSLILLINPKTKKVEEFYLEYYDENNEYVGDYDIEIGDKVLSYFIGFEKKVDDVDFLFSIEEITTVTDPITFEYKEQYPGKDFPCTGCKDLDLANAEFKYMFEEFGQQRSTFTKPISIENNSSASSSSKSVSISGFWMFFIFTIFLAIIVFKNGNKTYKI